jgi:hypothetical protein
MSIESFDLFDPARREALANENIRVEFLCGFHSVVAPVHNAMAYQTHAWRLSDTESLWQEQVGYMEGDRPGMGDNQPGWGASEERGGFANDVRHGQEFLEAYDEPYYEAAR